MNAEDFITNEQSERIYFLNKNDKDKQIQEQIKSFLKELYERRRGIFEKDGLNAQILIMPDACAAKVTEKDGKDPNLITNINLARYIEKKDGFIEKDGFYKNEVTKYNEVIEDEISEITNNGVDIKVIDNEDELQFKIESKTSLQTFFQVNILRKLVDNLWIVKQSEKYKSIKVGFSTPESYVEMKDLQENYDELSDAIETERQFLVDEYLARLNEQNKRKELKVDLHNHTTASDGRESPLRLLFRAYRRGLRTISITDHDKVGGYNSLLNDLEKLVSRAEEIEQNSKSDEEKEKNRKGVNRLLKVIEKMNLIPGCEVITCYKGSPYIEILAYGVDYEKLEKNLEEINAGKENQGDLLYKGLKELAEGKKDESIKLNIDLYCMENRNDYKRLFFHELKKHEENRFLFEDIDDSLPEEKQAELFAAKYFNNKANKDYYVDFNDKSKRKDEMLNKVQIMKKNNPKMIFDSEVIRNAGSATGQFFNELKKNPKEFEKIKKIDRRMDTLKGIIYYGIYSEFLYKKQINPKTGKEVTIKEKNPLYIDLSTTKPTPDEAIKAIHDAGGKAFIAHWDRYKVSNRKLFDCDTEEGRKNFIELLKKCDGAELEYSTHSEKFKRYAYKMCKKLKKDYSIGGDNHGKESHKDYGYFKAKPYILGAQKARDIKGFKWIKELVVSGKDVLRQFEIEHHYRRRLKNILRNNKKETHKIDNIKQFQNEQGA